jgi:hypothetical protein
MGLSAVSSQLSAKSDYNDLLHDAFADAGKT